MGGKVIVMIASVAMSLILVALLGLAYGLTARAFRKPRVRIAEAQPIAFRRRAF
jgi:hypothetical protein